MPDDFDQAKIPEQLWRQFPTQVAYVHHLGQFLSNVLTMETGLDVALAFRFVTYDDQQLFTASVLSHVPLGNKVEALEDALVAAGHHDARGLLRRARQAVERRNKLAHQSVRYGTDESSGETTITLTGRRGKETPVSVQELQDWVTDVRAAQEDVLEAASYLVERVLGPAGRDTSVTQEDTKQ